MRAVIKILVLLLVSSCSGLKKNVQFVKEQHEEKSTLVFEQELTKEILQAINDSTFNEVEIILVPNGKFTYEASTGFSGEATAVRIRQKSTLLRHQQLSEKLHQDANGRLEQTKTDLIKVKAKDLTRSKPNWLLLGICLTVCVSFCLCYKRLKKLWS